MKIRLCSWSHEFIDRRVGLTRNFFVSLLLLHSAFFLLNDFSLSSPVLAENFPNSPAMQVKNSSQTQLEIEKYFRGLPLTFEANRGQTDSSVKFLARAGHYTLFLTSSEAVFRLTGASSAPSPDKTPSTDPSVFSLFFPGANQTPQVLGWDELIGKSHYFIGNNPAMWLAQIPHYSKVMYRDIYPGVDLIFYGNHGTLEFDFIISPQGNPSSIQLAFQGARSLRMDKAGNLLLDTETGVINLKNPLVYQIQNGMKQPVHGQYLIHDNRVVFEIGPYEGDRSLIIDPKLLYSTYLGGDGTDFGNAIAIDSSGNVYLTGSTASTNFPKSTTPSPFQSSRNGSTDAFVTKLNPTASGNNGLLYSTYLGGSGDDSGEAIAIDSSNVVYLTGSTSSTDFPKTTSPAAFDTTLGGSQDAFLTKLNPAVSGTNGLLYSTYLGCDSIDTGTAIALDADRNAYLTGSTSSNNFPTKCTATPGCTAFDPSLGGAQDAFLAKLNPSASGNDGLLYSTYLGGDSSDTGNGIALDSTKNAFITGSTSSGNFPTKNPTQTSLIGPGDGFVTRMDLTLSGNLSLIFSTYLGGNGSEAGKGIVLDSNKNIYVVGNTGSTNFPTSTSPQAFQSSQGDLNDAFFAKVDPSGSSGSGGGSIPTGGGGSGSGGGGCFIATAAFGTPMAWQVQILREFRDRYLLSHEPGRFFVSVYYHYSPGIALVVADQESLRFLTRAILYPVIWWASLALAYPEFALLLLGVPLSAGPLLLLILLKFGRRRIHPGKA